MGRRLYVGNLSSTTRQKDVRAEFSHFGTISECVLKTNYAFVEFRHEDDAKQAVHELDRKEIDGKVWRVEHTRRGPKNRDRYDRDDDYRGDRSSHRRGRSRSYDRRDRRDNYRGRSPRYDDHRGGSRGGHRDAGRRGRGMRPQRGKFGIEVYGLSSATSWQDLKDWGRKAGDSVMYGDISRENGRKVGILEYDKEDDSKNALTSLHKSKLHGKTIFVYEEGQGPSRTPEASRSNSRRKSLSKSFSRSRSRKRSKVKDEGRSRSKSRSKSRSPSRRRSRDSRSRSFEKAKSPKRSRSRSKSPDVKEERKERSESRNREDD